jgi:hypothetical protein
LVLNMLRILHARPADQGISMAGFVDVPQFDKSADVPRGLEDQPQFASDHIYLVGFLVCSGHSIIGMSHNGARIAFEFSKTPELLADVARFMSGALVPARQFSFELLKLKRMLHGGK